MEGERERGLQRRKFCTENKYLIMMKMYPMANYTRMPLELLGPILLQKIILCPRPPAPFPQTMIIKMFSGPLTVPSPQNHPNFPSWQCP